jgi:NADH:ubiquinone oxidoreductase subunit E
MPPLAQVLERCATTPPNILATLQKVQATLGYVPHSAVPEIAHALGVTDSDVAGVLSFYHDLRTEPPGKHTIRFCLGESCLAAGAEKSLAAIEKKLGCELGQTTKDKRFTLEKVYCLGNCALSPCAMIGEDVHGHVLPKSLADLLKEYKK